VTLPSGARIADALAAVGGASPGTDLLTLNMAQPLSDGQQILVGVQAPPGTAPVSGGTSAPGSPPPGAPAAEHAGGKVNLNAATAAELEALPGVGPVMAKAILDAAPRAAASAPSTSCPMSAGSARPASLSCVTW